MSREHIKAMTLIDPGDSGPGSALERLILFDTSGNPVLPGGGRGVDSAKVAALDLARSATKHAADVAAATQFLEKWTNLSAWTPWGDSQVSGGFLFGGVAAAANGCWGASRGFSLGPTQRGGAVVRLRRAATVPSALGAIFMGVGPEAPGTVPTSFAASIYVGMDFKAGNAFLGHKGVNINPTGGTPPTGVTQGANNGLVVGAGNASGAADYFAGFTADENTITFFVFNSDGTGGHTLEAVWAVDRANMPTISNLYVGNNDTRALTGSSFGSVETVSGRHGRYVAPDQAARPKTATLFWGRMDLTQVGGGLVGGGLAGQAARIYLPSNYDDAVGAPVLLWNHGFGGGEDEMGSYAPIKPLFNTVLAAGIAIVSPYDDGNSYGNGAAMHDQRIAYRYFRDRLKLRQGVIIGGTSMGGLAATNAARKKIVPGVKGVGLFQPFLNLYAGLSNSNANAAAQAAAFGLTSITDAQASHKVAGYVPFDEPEGYIGMTFYISSSPSDTAAVKSINADAFVDLISDYATSITRWAASGDHNDPSMFNDPAFTTWALAALAA